MERSSLANTLQPMNPGRVKLLIVEDNDIDAQLAVRAMERYGVRSVKRARNAEQALEGMLKNPFDVVLCDYHLPRMNGLDMLGVVKKHWPETKFVLFTGAKDDKVAAAAIKGGADDYVSKDEFLTSGLINAVHATLRAEEDKSRDTVDRVLSSAAVDTDRMRAELLWLTASTIDGLSTEVPKLPTNDPMVENLVVGCAFYLQRLIAGFPNRPFKEEDSLVQMFLDRGSSPEEMFLVFDAAFARVLTQSKAADVPFSPSLPIARVVSRVVEAYQEYMAVQSMENFNKLA